MNNFNILIVDDEPINLAVLRKCLSPFFLVRACKSGEEALRLANQEPRPDLMLLDIMMPGMDGYDVLRQLQDSEDTRRIPVICITALSSIVDEEQGFRLGAVDYITKPFRPAIVVARAKAQLELKQARDRLQSQNAWLEAEVARRMAENELILDTTLSVITQLSETRDADTAHHIMRTRSYVEILARRLQHHPRYNSVLTDAAVANIVKASPLHDIGKIGIPDSILLKPGQLTDEEFAVMKSHCEIGGHAIRSAIKQAVPGGITHHSDAKPQSLVFLEEAELIALYHHERWDGGGYPEGLSGTDIPLSARFMALADVYDALTTPRVYKKPWHPDDAAVYITEQAGRHFDPDVVEAFVAERSAFENIRHLMADSRGGDRTR